MRALLPLLALVATPACADVPAHDLDAVLEYDGARYEGVIGFDDHDHDDNSSPGDDSCKLFSGDCGHSGYAVGGLRRGDVPVARAIMQTYEHSEGRTYDIYLRRNATDEEATSAAMKREPYRPFHAFTCRVYDSSLGKPVDCYGTTKKAILTLTPR